MRCGPRGTYRARPYAIVQEFAGSTPAPQTGADGSAPLDRPRTAPGGGSGAQPPSHAQSNLQPLSPLALSARSGVVDGPWRRERSSDVAVDRHDVRLLVL